MIDKALISTFLATVALGSCGAPEKGTLMKEPEKATIVKLSLEREQKEEIPELGLSVTHSDVVYEHDAEFQATIGYFDVKSGNTTTTICICLGNQEGCEGFLFNFVGEHSGKADLEIIKPEMNKIFPLYQDNRICLADVEIRLWSIVENKVGGFTVYFKIKEKEKEETVVVLEYPDSEKSRYEVSGKVLTVVKTINDVFVYLLFKDTYNVVRK